MRGIRGNEEEKLMEEKGENKFQAEKFQEMGRLSQITFYFPLPPLYQVSF